MQAVVSKPGQVAVVETVPIPSLQPGEILVKVVGVALNPTGEVMLHLIATLRELTPPPVPDWKTRDTPNLVNTVIGSDFSGTVEAVSSDVTHLKKGDKVAGFVNGGRGTGAFAEYLNILGSLVWNVPETVDWEEAAALGGIGPDTAIQALYERHKLEIPSKPTSEKTPFLIWGGSTSVGLYAIQFAALSGYTVIATSSPKNFELLKSFGASAAFDHSDPATPAKISAAYPDLKLALDTIAENGTTALTVKSLGKPDEGKIIKLLPVHEEDYAGHKTHIEMTNVKTVLGLPYLLGKRLWPASPEDKKSMEEWRLYTPTLVAEGKLRANPLWRREGGLEGIQEGLELLKAGKNSGQKITYRF